MDAGGFFGLEELVEIGKLKLEGKLGEAKKVKRKLKVTTMSDCKLSYMTKSAFLRLFGKSRELDILSYHTTNVDLNEIRNRVIANWQHKKDLHKSLC